MKVGRRSDKGPEGDLVGVRDQADQMGHNWQIILHQCKVAGQVPRIWFFPRGRDDAWTPLERKVHSVCRVFTVGSYEFVSVYSPPRQFSTLVLTREEFNKRMLEFLEVVDNLKIFHKQFYLKSAN